jgi:hypothetical protein
MGGLVSSVGSILLFADNSFQLQSGERSHIAALAQKYLLDDQGDHFFKIMLKCTDSHSRKYAGKLMKEVMSYLIKLYASVKDEYRTEKYEAVTEVKACIDNSLKLLIDNIKEREFAKNWTRIEAYLEMIFEIG